MTRALTRTNFHSSHLIRTLCDLAVLETGGHGLAFGEKLGLWIDFADAIALTRVLNSTPQHAPDATLTAAELPVHDEFAKARANLERAVVKSSSPNTGRTRAELSLPQLDFSLEDSKAYTPFRRYHQAHQRDMESSVRNVRAKVRDGVAAQSPKLRQLVALDAAFDSILAEREARLLSTIPSLMEKRFNQLRKAHLQTLPTDASPDLRTAPGPWLARFCAELQTVLLAELDLRLQPAVGLLEALHNERTLQPV